MRPPSARARRAVLAWLACVGIAALVSTPVAIERAVEHAQFEDRLGTLPVEVRLAHDGVSTLDSGVLGELYWRRTGWGGFGAEVRSTGPPLADGTLASYVSPTFVQANASFVDHPEEVALAYGGELRHQVVVRSLQGVVVGGVVGGTLLLILLRGGVPFPGDWSRRRRWAVGVGLVATGLAVSTGAGAVQFHRWSGPDPSTGAYELPGHEEFSFSSPQTREIAQQIGPFVEKNTDRIEADARSYEAAAEASITDVVPDRVDELLPRDGEVVVVAEADPQGSRVGTRVRKDLYAALREQLGGDGRLVLRTVAGDISSNGTVAEKGFIRGEAAASGDLPVVFAKGDHDTDTTVDQLLDAGVPVPDTEVVDAGGLRVASARDPAFKALFGGLVVNDTDATEQQLGESLRTEVDDDTDDGEPVVVVLHQPNAVAGYLGLGTPTLDEFKARSTSLITPVDDGVPDLPPGIVTYGHLHDADGPWVVWNTDGGPDEPVTWTVVTQLGTSGGVEENPTFNRFSTPFSPPLKTVNVQLQYVDQETGLQTGFTELAIATDGTLTVADRVDVGLPNPAGG